MQHRCVLVWVVPTAIVEGFEAIVEIQPAGKRTKRRVSLVIAGRCHHHGWVGVVRSQQDRQVA